MSDPKSYTVGWICALRTELTAATSLLDEKHPDPERVADRDSNVYVLGRIGCHNVVIAALPEWEYGIASAAGVAMNMLSSFPNVRIGLLVGIGGGAPSERHDIRLGDVVVSAPRGMRGGVYQYDFGAAVQNQEFKTTGFLNQPPKLLLTAITAIRSQYEMEGHHINATIKQALERYPRLLLKYSKPDQHEDILYPPEMVHPLKDNRSCELVCRNNIDDQKLKQRRKRTPDEDDPAIYYGIIASANCLMKDAYIRDKLAAKEDILCFEMEAAGLINQFPCLVIRGICDYSDTHKIMDWQGYAAMTAAAYAKDLLKKIPPNNVEVEQRVSELLSGVQEGVNELRRRQHSQENSRIFNWLSPIDYTLKQKDHFSQRLKGTGQWLLNSTEYQGWLSTDNQTLFCPGIPGAGKTIMTSIVVNNLIATFGNKESVGIAYIYCNFQQRTEQTAENLLRSILSQLAQDLPELPSCINELYPRPSSKREAPSLSHFSKALLSIATMYSRVFIIVDALDECQEDGHCRSTFLSEIFDLQSKTQVNFFATSRYIPDITEKFRGCLQHSITASRDDVYRYLSDYMSQLPNFIQRLPLLQEKIKTDITNSVKGMFLLARLYIDSLKDKLTEKAVETALVQFTESTEVPSEENIVHALDDAYERAMVRIREQRQGFRSLAEKVLSWIICAKRQLTTTELQHALGVELGRTELDRKNLPHLDDMVRVCIGLVMVDKKSEIIRLAHYTTYKYFERSQKKWFPNAESDITATCVTYLLFSAFESGFCRKPDEFNELLKLNPLYRYAGNYWGVHARNSAMCSEDVINLLKNPRKAELSSRALNFSNPMTGLHLAAYFGIPEAICPVIQHLLDQRLQVVDMKDSYGRTPLWWAAANGHEETVQLLVQEGATVKVKDSYGQTPLLRAAGNGRKAIVLLLLATKDIDVDSRDGFGRKPVLRRWLNNELSDDDYYGRTPLLWAAGNGHTDVLKLLLETRKVNFNSQDSYGRTPLSWAAANGHAEIVRLLVEQGAEVNMADHDGRTPLLWAAKKGYTAVVKLLDNAVDVKAQGYGYTTALQAASGEGHLNLVRLLLDRKFDISIQNEYYADAAEAASKTGRLDVMRMLLDKGADINVQRGYYNHAFLIALAGGHLAIVQLLLDRDVVDVNAHSSFHTSSFQAAIAGGNLDLIQLLFDKGMEVDIQGGDYNEALLVASREGYIDVAQFLLDRGADINTQDIYYGNPIQAAAARGSFDIARLFLDRGAEINAQGGHYGNALQAAAARGTFDMTRLLLDRGAEVNAQGGYYGNALQAAAARGSFDIVRLLINRGADVNGKNKSGQRPLATAITHGNKALLRLLRSHGAQP